MYCYIDCHNRHIITGRCMLTECEYDDDNNIFCDDEEQNKLTKELSEICEGVMTIACLQCSERSYCQGFYNAKENIGF